MKKSLSVIIFILLWLNLYSKNSNDFILGVIPWGDKEKMLKEYAPVVDFLSEKLNKNVSFLFVENYDELGKLVCEGYIDIGMFTPIAYIKAKELNNKIQYLNTTIDKRTKKSVIESYIFVRKDKNIRDIKDLKDKTIVYVDKNSASGYKFPYYLMIEKWKINPKTYFKKELALGTHANVLQAVYEGQADVGVTADEQFYIAIEKYGENPFFIIDKVENIPHGPQVASPFLDKEIIEKIKTAFYEMNKGTKTSKGISVFFPNEIKSESFYDIVSETEKTMKKYENDILK